MYKNKFFLLTYLLIIIYFIKKYILKINNNFIVNPGNIMITNRTYSSWQFIKPLKYSSEKIGDLYIIKYHHIMNTTINDYILFKGDIVLLNKNNINNDIVYDAIFKDSLNRYGFNLDFKNNFKTNLDMDGEVYDVAIKNGYLYIMFLKNCSDNNVLFEENNICYIKNNTYNEINDFLNTYYFDEKFIT